MKASAGSTKSAEAISAAPSGSGSGSGGKESESTFNPSGRTRKIATEQGQDPLSSLTNEDGNGNGNGNGNAVASSSTSSSDQEAASESFDDGRRPQVYEYGINVEEHIADALAVEEIDVDLYKSISLWQPSRARGVFGGQVIAQALAASSKTIRQGPVLHSMHCYFLLAGDPNQPIIYTVKRVRDGGSYVTRSVNASQKGRTIFILFSSYQMPEPKQPRFAIPLAGASFEKPSAAKVQGEGSKSVTWSTEEVISQQPPQSSASSSKSPVIDVDKMLASAPSPSPSASEQSELHASEYSWTQFVHALRSPEDSPPNEARYTRVIELHGSHLPKRTVSILNEWVKDRKNSAVEIRDALPGMYDENTGLPTPGSGQAFWMRTKEEMKGGPEGQKHALAYASDFYLLSAVPKALGVMRKLKMMASLDHSMWFYDDFDVHDWILYVMQMQAGSNGRGVVLGRLYRRDGTLVAVVAQEGMVRARLEDEEKKKDSKI